MEELLKAFRDKLNEFKYLLHELDHSEETFQELASILYKTAENLENTEEQV